MRSFYFKAISTTILKATATAAVMLMLLSLTACSLFGPIGPVPENVESDVQTGPGLFTGKTGEFSVSDFFDPEKKNKNRSRDITVTGSDVDIPAIDLDSFEEFERLEQPNISEYSNFPFENIQPAMDEYIQRLGQTPVTTYIVLPTDDFPRTHITNGPDEFYLNQDGSFSDSVSSPWTGMLKELHLSLIPH